jgi:hypothetical protein
MTNTCLVKTPKTQWEKYGERVHYYHLMHVHIIASLKTLHEKLQENSLRKKRVQHMSSGQIVIFWIIPF